jgi:hypothetical protein
VLFSVFSLILHIRNKDSFFIVLNLVTPLFSVLYHLMQSFEMKELFGVPFLVMHTMDNLSGAYCMVSITL